MPFEFWKQGINLDVICPPLFGGTQKNARLQEQLITVITLQPIPAAANTLIHFCSSEPACPIFFQVSTAEKEAIYCMTSL